MRAMFLASVWKSVFLATKSVSELTSTATPSRSRTNTATSPSAATLPDFLAALESPFLRSQSIAASISPSVSPRAVLQSIMPAPVFSRRSFTIAAVTFAILVVLHFQEGPSGQLATAAETRRPANHSMRLTRCAGSMHRFISSRCAARSSRDEAPCKIDPAVACNPAAELEVMIDLFSVLWRHGSDLPVMVDAGIVEFLDNLRSDARQFGKIVRSAAGRGQEFEDLLWRLMALARGALAGSQFFCGRAFRFTKVDASRPLPARNAVNCRTRRKITIKGNRPARIVIARNRISDSVGIAVCIEDRRYRNMQPLRLLDRQLLLVRVDNEDQIGNAPHILDAAKRLLQLITLARDHEPLFLGHANRARAQGLVQFAQALDRSRDRLPVGEHAAEPAGIDVILRRAFRGVGNRFLGLPLGADEKHAPALGDRVRNGLQGLMQQRNRLCKINDMDIVADAKNIGRHLRVPAVRLVPEMSPGFEETAHREFRQSHVFLSPVEAAADRYGPPAPEGFERPPGAALEAEPRKPRVEWGRL